MKKLFLLLVLMGMVVVGCSKDEGGSEDNFLKNFFTGLDNVIIYYTSSNGKIVTPYDSSAFGATIISNTYKDGVGVIEFIAPITTIGENAFYGCPNLTSITIPDSVTSIGYCAFEGCSSLTSVTIPDSVTTIGNYAFSECSSLTSVTIGDSVISIGYGAFVYCSSLTSITIPDSVTTIGTVFYGCSSLTSVTIPDSVTTIAHMAFYDCSSLTSVYCKPITPPDGGFDMFDNNAYGRKIYVPKESVVAYKSADGWRYYANAIVGYDF